MQCGNVPDGATGRGCARIEGVARVVKIGALAELGDDARDEVRVIGAAREVIAHFVDRVRAAHQSAEGCGIEFFFGFEFARR